MLLVTRRISNYFAKWSKPKPKTKSKEYAKSFAVGDEKAAKLSKSEQEQENKVKAVKMSKIESETIRKMAMMKTHSVDLEEFKSKAELQNVKYYQELYLMGKTKKKATTKVEAIEEEANLNYQYFPVEESILNSETNKYAQFKPNYGNYTKEVNSKLPRLEEFQGQRPMRRMGSMGMKLGMTTMYDQWGDIVPVTIILLDRCQVVQIKRPEMDNKFYQVQMGLGDKKIKTTNKAQMGHYLKARVPPKRVLAEFPVSEECLIPVGYMISARHYTPGMFVDISGKSVGHGFSGTIKRHGFGRQPASHGNSLTTRVLGSTGGHQNPGRVFKQKKMYGRMGGNTSVQRGMAVFKIDVEKNILYIKGSLPGKAGTILKICDTLLHDKSEDNLSLSHFPTFVEQQGVTYAKQFSMYCGERDPLEIEIHDNAFILDDGDEADKEEGAEPKDKDLED